MLREFYMNSVPVSHVASASVPAEWGTLQDAATRYAVSVKTIRRMIARGEVDARRVGSRMIRVNLTTLATALRPINHWAAL
jgi:excisionase family DNA binding protein